MNPYKPGRIERHVIVQTDRYGGGWKNAPSAVIINGGNLKLARHLAHVMQEYCWPGQEWMFVVKGDDGWDGECGCDGRYSGGY